MSTQNPLGGHSSLAARWHVPSRMGFNEKYSEISGLPLVWLFTGSCQWCWPCSNWCVCLQAPEFFIRQKIH